MLDGTAPPLGTKYGICTSEFYRPFKSKLCSTTKKEVKNRFLKFDKLAIKYSSDNEGLYYTPLREGLCKNYTCGVKTRNGNTIWIDFGHITENSASELSVLLEQKLIKQKFSWDRND